MNIFIGELPPPYGGVTIKDKLLFQEVYGPAGVKFLNLTEAKWKPWKIPWIGTKILWYLLFADNVIVGVGSNFRRKVLSEIRYILRGQSGLSKIQMIVMGGNIQNQTPDNPKLKKLLQKCGSLWVETNGMKNSLEKQGFSNIKIYPNCRTGKGALPPRPVSDTIKFVFFSRICAMKGVDEIIESIDEWTIKWSLDFYGEIASEYREKFESFLKQHPEVAYHGVFDSANGNVYEELNQYDVMLFPSKYEIEGIPGTLVESKMSGITAIVSDKSFNREIVIDNEEGIVIKNSLSETINSLDIEFLFGMKNKAFISRRRYISETYKQDLVREL